MANRRMPEFTAFEGGAEELAITGRRRWAAALVVLIAVLLASGPMLLAVASMLSGSLG
jgi:hypothetical protein